MNTQHFARGRTSCLAQTLPFFGLLHPVLLEPDGIDVDEASCVTDHQSAKAVSNQGLGLGTIDSGGEVEGGKQCGFENILISIGLKSTSESMEASSEE
jgi:hypothetical protein